MFEPIIYTVCVASLAALFLVALHEILFWVLKARILRLLHPIGGTRSGIKHHFATWPGWLIEMMLNALQARAYVDVVYFGTPRETLYALTDKGTAVAKKGRLPP